MTRTQLSCLILTALLLITGTARRPVESSNEKFVRAMQHVSVIETISA